VQAVVACLEKGADVNVFVIWEAYDSGGRVKHEAYDTPLHLAARKGDVAIVRILLAHGADVEWRNAERRSWLAKSGPGSGLTPLGVAVKEGHKEVADLLRQHGARE
jgi:ankyrin repeat protein